MNVNIVIPTLNRADLLKESVEDLHQNGWFTGATPSQLLIIDNGDQDLSFLPESEHITVYRPGKNLGVAASWNYGLGYFSQKEVTLILNDDIVLGKTQMDIAPLAKKVFNNKTLMCGTKHWCTLLFSNNVYRQIGRFDENFYPAYYEDDDYMRRLKIAGVRMLIDSRLDPEVFRNSQTIAKDSQVNKNFDKNKAYFNKKWPNKQIPFINEAFMYNGELEILKARILQTYPQVKKWIIVESSHTFQGNKHSRTLLKDLEDPLFDPYRDRIIPVEYELTPRGDAWSNEYTVRNKTKSLLPEGEWCFLSDVDEIPDYSSMLPKVWENIPDTSKTFHPKMWDQYYNISWAFTDDVVAGTLFFNGKEHRKSTGQELRNAGSPYSITVPGKSGWHLSYFMSPERIKQKLESFAHKEFNTPFYKDLSRIKKCIDTGNDLFKRGRDMENTYLNLAYKAPSYFSHTIALKNSLRLTGLKYGTDKATYHEYCETYQDHFPKLGEIANLLEIGVSTGASIKMWSEWYGPDAQIEGWEIRPEWFIGKIPENAKVKKVDATDPEQVDHTREGRTFDIVIDDGSHRHQDMVDTFNMLYPHTNYIYVIEDIHTVTNNDYKNGTEKPVDPKTFDILPSLKFDQEKVETVFIRNREKDSWSLIVKKDSPN